MSSSARENDRSWVSQCLTFLGPSLVSPSLVAIPKGWTITPQILCAISGDTGMENPWATSLASSSAAFFDPSSAHLWFPLAIIP